MATQKRSSSKKATKAGSARRTSTAKATAPARRKRASASTLATSRTGRKGGILKRAIRKGISELAKVGS